MNAKPRLNEKSCSNRPNTVVVVKAQDNYQSVFSLPELDPKYGHGQILLADHRNGQPLDSVQGPLQVIVADEPLHSRWGRQVKLIEVRPIGEIARAIINSIPH